MKLFTICEKFKNRKMTIRALLKEKLIKNLTKNVSLKPWVQMQTSYSESEVSWELWLDRELTCVVFGWISTTLMQDITLSRRPPFQRTPTTLDTTRFEMKLSLLIMTLTQPITMEQVALYGMTCSKSTSSHLIAVCR